jgi:TRAP transporter TAXI family solute receptor
VTNNPDIKTVYDLKGKKIAFGAPGSTTYLSQGPALMKAHGMTYKDVKPQSLAYSEAIEAMKDKNLDAALIGAGAPTAAVIDLFNLDPKARIIPIGAAEMKKMSEFDPYCFGWELPANTYKGQTTAILQPAIAQILVVNKNVPDDVVYRMTKAIDQKRNELVKSHGVFKEWSHKSAFLGRHIPFHPGAEKYWREVKLIK